MQLDGDNRYVAQTFKCGADAGVYINATPDVVLRKWCLTFKTVNHSWNLSYFFFGEIIYIFHKAWKEMESLTNVRIMPLAQLGVLLELKGPLSYRDA